MQIMTCDTANKTIRRLNEERDLLLKQEAEASTYSHLYGEEPLVPEYDFLATQQKIMDLNRRIMVLKHAVNVFNTTHTSPNTGLTIDAMLVRMAMLSKDKERLNAMRGVPAKTRTASFGSKASEFTVRNYDVADVEVAYECVTSELLLIQQELNTMNMTLTFEVDI